MKLEYSGQYKKKQISNFMKIHPVGTEFFHAGGQIDGQTEIMKLIVAF
jgi:hypothetical protein